MKIVTLILHYNVPDVTDRLVENLRQLSRFPGPTLVVDNGSDPGKLSKYITHTQRPNNRMTGGFNFGLEMIRQEHPDSDAVWFFTSDCYFTTGHCPYMDMQIQLERNPDIGILHPSEEPTVHCCWDVHNQAPSGIKLGWMYDFVCPLITRQALDLWNWQFRPELTHGWGIDFESAYLVRQAGLKVGINHQLRINHETSTTYDRGMDDKYANRQRFYDAALVEMRRVLGQAYGPDWEYRFQHEYTEGVGTWRL